MSGPEERWEKEYPVVSLSKERWDKNGLETYGISEFYGGLEFYGEESFYTIADESGHPLTIEANVDNKDVEVICAFRNEGYAMEYMIQVFFDEVAGWHIQNVGPNDVVEKFGEEAYVCFVPPLGDETQAKIEPIMQLFSDWHDHGHLGPR